MKNIVCFILFFNAISAFAQRYLADNEYHYSLINGLELLIVQDPADDQDITLNLTFKTGPFIENEEMNGISYFCEKLFTHRFKSQLFQNIEELTLNLSLIEVSSKTSLENVSYQVIFPGKYFTQVLRSINNNMTVPDLNIEDYKLIRAQIHGKYDSLLSNRDYWVHQKTNKLLWGVPYLSRQIVISPVDSISDSLLHQAVEFVWQNYYCAGNALLSLKGNVQVRPTLDEVKKSFNNWDRCRVNPFIRYPVPNYTKLRFSVQHIDEHFLHEPPKFKISFQGPHTGTFKASIYPAIVLSYLLSDSGFTTYKFFTDSLGMESMKMSRNLRKYANELSIEFTTDSVNVHKAYVRFWNGMKALTVNPAILENDLSAVRKNVIENFRSIKSNPADYLDLVSGFWAGASLDSYGIFKDSIASVTIKSLQSFINKLILDNHYIASLSITPQVRSSSKIDSLFTETKKDIKEYHFQFLANTAKFEDNSYESELISLVQFLKSNPGIKIKVNGVAHTGELQNVNDKEMFQYFKSMKHFVFYPKPKKSIRLDVYRSMLIIKKLIEAGIEPTRLFGTGFLDRKGNGQYVYCTLLSKE